LNRVKLSALTALALLLLGTVWAFASPRGSSADEGFHLTNIWCAWGDSDLCKVDPNKGVALVPESIVYSPCFAEWPSQNGAGCLSSLSMDLVETDRISFSPFSYSIGFFKTMRVFAGENVELSVQLIRLFNVALASGLLFWALATSTRTVSRALAISWGVSIIPVGIFFIASANPSSWTIMGVGTYWAFLASALGSEQKTSRQTRLLWIGVVASALIALLARVDSGIYLVVATVAVLIWRWQEFTKKASKTTLVASLIGFVVLISASAAILLNRFKGVTFSFPGAQTSNDHPAPLVKALLELPAFVFGLFGGQVPKFIVKDSEVFHGEDGYSFHGYIFGVGWTEYPLPSLVGLLIGAAAFTTLTLGLSRSTKLRVLAVLIVMVAFVVQMALMRASQGFSMINNANLQPRYFFPYALIALGIAASISQTRRPFFSRVQVMLLSLPLLVAGSLAWVAVATRYAVKPSATYTNFGQPIEWWWSIGPGRLAWFLVAMLVTAIWLALTLGAWGRLVQPPRANFLGGRAESPAAPNSITKQDTPETE